MEALMYGWMDRAKMVAFENAPPLITSSRPRMVLCCWAKYALQQGDVDVRNRDGVAKTVKEDDDQREEYLLAQLFDLPCITQCLKHLDHLCLSAGRLDLLFRGFGESSSL